MRKTVTLLIILILATSSIMLFLPARADARTIVVPNHYSTIEAAIANAHEGDTIFFREGTYEGPINQTIVIDKKLSLVGENAANTTIKLYPAYNVSWILTACFYSHENAITITADDCKILNLTIWSMPGGEISVVGNRVRIVGNNIKTGSTATGVEVKGSYSRLTDNNMLGVIRLTGSFSEIARNTLYGISVVGSLNLIKDNTCQDISLDNSTNNVVTGNKLRSTTRGFAGIYLSHSHNNFIYKNLVAEFSTAIRFWFSSNNTVAANSIDDSLHTIRIGASHNNSFYLNNLENNNWWNDYVIDQYSDPWVREYDPNMTVSHNQWDNGLIGNHWGNYNGSDVNGDGIGDSPYILEIEVRYFEGNEEKLVADRDSFPIMSRVDIDSVNVELPAWALNLPEPEPQEPTPQVTLPKPQEPEATTPTPTSSIEPQQGTELKEPESFPILPVAAVASITAVAVGIAGLLVHFRKYRFKVVGFS